MRTGVALLAAILLLCGCAQGLRSNADRAAIVSAAEAHIRTRHVCLEYQFGEELPSAPDANSLLAFRQPDGSYAYDAGARRGLDAFVAAGLMTVEERTFDQAQPPFAARHYRRTEAAAGPARTGLGPPALCYGYAFLVQILKIDRPPRSPCADSSVYVDVLYAYGTFPPWVDHPAIAAAYPDRLRAADHDAVRFARIPLRQAARGWAYAGPPYGMPNCIE